jgi:ribonucleoside-triphosphate reductase
MPDELNNISSNDNLNTDNHLDDDNDFDVKDLFVKNKLEFINKFKKASNTANSTIDDNSNVSNKNVAILNSEIHKSDNIRISRAMVMDKLKELYPEFNSKRYIRDLEDHVIYKHDESSFAGAIAPYCVSVTMYPFLMDGIKGLGGLSASPKNIKSFCGIFCNMIFAISSQFAGAVAVSEALLYFTYFCKKEWGDDFYKRPNEIVERPKNSEPRTILKEIQQYWQQIIYTINQPAAARGFQSAFVNFSYFDKPFFEGMFGEFYFPDGAKPDWESLKWIQMEFMKWFNAERLKTILTFPVETVTLLYKDGKFEDEEMAQFVYDEYARGHSFFTYISDSVDSLASCCRVRNAIQDRGFSFTNGNISIQTGSKSVITFNLNRLAQMWYRKECEKKDVDSFEFTDQHYPSLKKYLSKLTDRVYKYHHAYNELLWDMYDANLLPAYRAGFIDLNKQYLTLGLNGLNQAAEFLGIKCSVNDKYSKFCQEIFSFFKEQNELHRDKTSLHQLMFNTEQVPAESLASKNYNWDKNDGFWVPEDTNLYASYVFKPNDNMTSVLDKIKMHGRDYIGDYLDGGSAAHINLDSHLSSNQYKKLLEYSAKAGCSYLTFNIPMTECKECGKIVNIPVDECPECHSKNLQMYTRIIGYLTAIKNWNDSRKKEFESRVFNHLDSHEPNESDEYIKYNRYKAK